MRKIIYITLTVALLMIAGGCDKVNNTEVPKYPVRLQLKDYGLWSVYGVHGLGDWKLFVRSKGLPEGFPYNANTLTGYGGVLLMMGSQSYPVAYDASCPVENQQSIIVEVASNLEAVCPKCGSRYNVFEYAGQAVSGIAATSKLGLRIITIRDYDQGNPTAGCNIYSY